MNSSRRFLCVMPVVPQHLSIKLASSVTLSSYFSSSSLSSLSFCSNANSVNGDINSNIYYNTTYNHITKRFYHPPVYRYPRYYKSSSPYRKKLIRIFKVEKLMSAYKSPLRLSQSYDDYYIDPEDVDSDKRHENDYQDIDLYRRKRNASTSKIGRDYYYAELLLHGAVDAEKTARDIMSYVRWMMNGYDRNSMACVIETTKQVFGKLSLDEFDNYCVAAVELWQERHPKRITPTPLHILFHLSGEYGWCRKPIPELPPIAKYMSSESYKEWMEFSGQMVRLWKFATDKKCTDSKLYREISNQLYEFHHFSTMYNGKDFENEERLRFIEATIYVLENQEVELIAKRPI